MSRTHLSPRQRQVLTRIAHGATYRQVATELGVKEATVRGHVHRILTDLGANSSAHAIHIAHQRGLLDTTERPAARYATELLLTAQGLTAEQVADRLGITRGAADDRLRQARRLLRARTIAHAIALAIRSGLVHPDQITEQDTAA
ncbi:response regulator transcription factor [Streptomyces aidingensis]|uniref:Regulatory protein, luxR family n=1 Tax=Streptomyces aidingensis TaxID=910347 RepID=A0A1I1PV72_9ACTN|nr:helix-turn-helix transcriptional regulator [Streptomyces aidingensis]SFD13562.1 regulatory protein, luxR family [Streptomyces aidingensis]